MLPYICKDIVCDPPVYIVIVDEEHDKEPALTSQHVKLNARYVEDTEGWRNRAKKPSVNICFMHSFGKCAGPTGEGISMCHQVHIQRDVLNELRRHYTNPQRPFFCKTINASLGARLRDMISAFRQKKVNIWFLTYKTGDVVPTSGLYRFEANYRRWLFDETSDKTQLTTNTAYAQCENYALFGWCPNGENCLGIHAPLNKAVLKEASIIDALQKVTSAACATQTSIYSSSSAGISTPAYHALSNGSLLTDDRNTVTTQCSLPYDSTVFFFQNGSSIN